MTRHEELTALRARVLEAKGPSRDLEGQLWRAVMPAGSPRGLRYGPVPALTCLIDAALALVERVLPGWAVNIGAKWQGNLPYACIADPEDNGAEEPWNVEHEVHDASAATPPLAILAALLSALLSREDATS